MLAVVSVTPAIAQSGSRSSVPAPAVSVPANIAPANSVLVNSFASPIMSTEGTDLPSLGSSTKQSSGGSIGIPAAAVADSVFEINDPSSTIAIDHSAWDQFLSCYLITDSQGLNRIHYGRVSAADRQQLEGYLSYLQSVDLRTLNRNEQLAYWFNLYNAKIVDVVLAHYPIRSIRQIKQKFTDFEGPFNDPGSANVLGKSLSLSDIESGVIRPIYKDPRIHFALNCGSYGCPNLATTAWTAENLDARLNGAAVNFINSGRAVKSGLLGLRVSKIFKWYKDDFGGSDEAVIAYMQQYANPATCRQLQKAHGRVAGHFYDWSLNDAKITRPRLLEPFIR